MADVRVPATWFAQGYQPGICARHGGPATTTRKRTLYTRIPPWFLLLLIGSVLLFLIVVLLTRKTIEGPMPACDRCTTERRRYLRSVAGGWVGCLLLFIAAGFSSNVAVLVLGGIAVVAALVWSCLGDVLRVRGWLSKDQVWLDLKGVSPVYASAIQLAARAASQQPPMAAWQQPMVAQQPSVLAPQPAVLASQPPVAALQPPTLAAQPSTLAARSSTAAQPAYFTAPADFPRSDS
jgi:hypothetical protein